MIKLKNLILILLASLILLSSCIQKPVASKINNCNFDSPLIKDELKKCNFERENCKINCDNQNIKECNENCNTFYSNCFNLIPEKIKEIC